MSLTTSAHWMYNPGGGFYDHEIDGSLRFNDNDSAYLSRTPSSAPTDGKKVTLSGWFKRGNLGTLQTLFCGNTDGSGMLIQLDSSNRLYIYDFGAGSGGFQITSTRLFRDCASWYHFMFAFDTTQGTASNRAKVYVNGIQEDLGLYSVGAGASRYPNQNATIDFNANGTAHRIGSINGGAYWDGYIAEINVIDGQQLDETDLGETKSGIWIPKDYSGSYGTNGFHLEFAGNANDTSGNGNNWTANNISSYDYVPDSPTNNFATLNILNNQSGITVYQANLRATSGPTWRTITSTYVVNNGKWYWEYRAFNDCYTGMADNEYISSTAANLALELGWRATNGQLYYRNSVLATYSSYTTGDIISYAYDADTGKLWIAKNGTWQNSGNPAAGTGNVATLDTSYGWTPAISGYNSGAEINFGQDSTFQGNTTAGGNADGNGYGDFKYAPPSGFVALCSANLPAPAIDPADDETPEDYFNTVLWTGNNTNNRAITGVGFQPDLVVAKSRTANSGFNWVDAVRGGTKNLRSSSTDAEQTVNTVISFQSDGFTVGDGNGYDINKSGEPIVGWSWLAGNSTSSNTDGSITSTVSANTDAGFSIVTYTGNGTSNGTVGHGLGEVPSLIICKIRSSANDWRVFHKDLTDGHSLYLNRNLASGSQTNRIANNPTSTTFNPIYIDGGAVNANGSTYVAYCFAEKDGYSKFGSYTGNSSSDGSFIYTGFRPAFILIKKYSNSDDWAVHDNRRADYGTDSNPIDDYLKPHSSVAEGDDGASVDFLSNGFKWRINSGMRNQSGESYIYMAFAEQPFKYANAR